MSDLLDNPKLNDNRDYMYSDTGFYFRQEFPIISDLIATGSKVIDLGCGNGSMMAYVLEKKAVDIIGVEITQSGIENCIKHNLLAKLGAIDKKNTYIDFKDDQFDYAICNVTLQMVMYPEVLLSEMRRISRFQIISFPNFAYFGNRFDLMFNGCMPRPMLHSYSWYNTGHIHQLSVRDFKNYCHVNNWKIMKEVNLGCFRKLADVCLQNFFSKESIFLLSK